MKINSEYDVFISFYHEDEQKVRPIYDKLMRMGLKVFWSVRILEPGKPYPPELEKALVGSQHFLLYFSEGAAKSEWVRKEWQVFLDQCHLRDKEHRRMYVMLDGSCNTDIIPALLKDIHRPKSDQLVPEIVRSIMSERRERNELLQRQLEQERRKAEEAQNYYRYNRFWGPISVNRDIHIFTCARDIAHDPKSSRGFGGRTNIDMWDYRAVLDITHFLASNYPNAKVTIEDPMSKLHGDDLERAPLLAERMSHMRSMIEGKDCIIIGSPDVSDFAEIVLAKIHQIAPYTEGRTKKQGFVVIKAPKYTSSSFYWEKRASEEEGAAEILGTDEYKYFPHKLATEGHPGKMYGILVVANNPFGKADQRRKIIILSGFSGVATNAIAKILTDDKCLHEFYKLDSAYVNMDRDVEALIGVEYVVDKNSDDRDTRRIKGITFESLVEI
ncbi:toll/interleukin-1 receptor domain-containing protein [candidate division KSB1 bacterium]|nr:toll/interleukin-1 receptor domain-containing protein [candidate division KSB1 bacterium]